MYFCSVNKYIELLITVWYKYHEFSCKHKKRPTIKCFRPLYIRWRKFQVSKQGPIVYMESPPNDWVKLRRLSLVPPRRKRVAVINRISREPPLKRSTNKIKLPRQRATALSHLTSSLFLSPCYFPSDHNAYQYSTSYKCKS